jgi:nucleosome binding factor SPN SPT16 subunit
MKLTKDENEYNYSDEAIAVSFDLVDFHVKYLEKLKDDNPEITLKNAAQMKVLIDSVTGIQE